MASTLYRPVGVGATSVRRAIPCCSARPVASSRAARRAAPRRHPALLGVERSSGRTLLLPPGNADREGEAVGGGEGDGGGREEREFAQVRGGRVVSFPMMTCVV